jgi:Helix-hairpin-helix domain
MLPGQDIFAGLTLPPRACAALARNQITSTEALLSLNARELRALPGVGAGTIKQILDALAVADLALAR